MRCRCARCALEERLFSVAPAADRSLRSLWRRFERLRRSGHASEEDSERKWLMKKMRNNSKL